MNAPLFDAFWILAALPFAVYALMGIAILVWLVMRHYGHWRRDWLLMVSPVLVFVALQYVGSFSFWGWSLWQFHQNRPLYETIVADESAGLPMTRDVYGDRYSVDAGPPIRIAFVVDGGVADNWTAVVYDPSHIVRTATGWRGEGSRQQYTASPEAKKLFGGDLLACRHITDAYYRCSFT